MLLIVVEAVYRNASDGKCELAHKSRTKKTARRRLYIQWSGSVLVQIAEHPDEEHPDEEC
jgi:hypothetical protein